jgi:TolB-like protein
MSESMPAVFLSYAREDTAAARRIADALGAFGIEVWLDQSELRGGETWDATIRQRIKDCALFIAVVSANTQRRREGYFRREWNLAVERTLDMAHGTPFIVPVVVDDTPEASAIVPEQFMRVQWSRLPQGVPDEKFVGQLKRLLAPPGQPAREPTRPRTASPSDPLTAPAPAPAKPRMPVWLRAALAVVVIGGGLAIALGPKPSTRGASKAPDKSLAVLPFTNMSDEKENAYFADGIHEDILTNLAVTRELHVVSRTSVMQYRDTKLSMRQIGETLNVAYVLQGSVRGRGSKVRVTVQLIDARTDEHAWAKTFDPDLSDIFATQTELAKEIAAQLKATIAVP